MCDNAMCSYILVGMFVFVLFLDDTVCSGVGIGIMPSQVTHRFCVG